MDLAPHDFTALAPHDYTAPAPHDCTAPAPSPRARYANDSEFKFGPGYPKIAKFLVPVDGSQQNFVRSSPAGTHRTFLGVYDIFLLFRHFSFSDIFLLFRLFLGG